MLSKLGGLHFNIFGTLLKKSLLMTIANIMIHYKGLVMNKAKTARQKKDFTVFISALIDVTIEGLFNIMTPC